MLLILNPAHNVLTFFLLYIQCQKIGACTFSYCKSHKMQICKIILQMKNVLLYGRSHVISFLAIWLIQQNQETPGQSSLHTREKCNKTPKTNCLCYQLVLLQRHWVFQWTENYQIYWTKIKFSQKHTSNKWMNELLHVQSTF